MYNFPFLMNTFRNFYKTFRNACRFNRFKDLIFRN